MPQITLQPKPDQLQSAPAPSSSRGLLLVVLFCVGLFGTAALIDRLLPFPPIPSVKEKIEWFAQHGEPYDTLFVGSSRTNAHIIPELFDQLMAQAGLPTHSYNLGINGMRSPEDSYVLETALAHRHSPLKLLVAEANAVQIYTDDDQAHGTLRAVYWHDFKRLVAICRCIVETKMDGRRQWSPLSLLGKAEAIRYNVNLYLSKTLSSGRGLEVLEARLVEKPPRVLAEIGKRHDGYILYDTPLLHITDNEWALIEKRLQKLPSKPIVLDYKTAASQIELQAKHRLATSFGAQMVTFIPPLAGGPVFAPNPALLPGVANFNFADPARYPALFQRENRFDAGHLNQQGAEIFTRLLAEKIIAARCLQKTKSP